MNYISTRGQGGSVSASKAIMQGICSDGGLFIPESIPVFEKDALGKLVNMSYKEKAKYVLSMYLSDFTGQEIENCVENAYKESSFGSENSAPLKVLGNSRNVLELWHGPTCAFKDMALQILPHLLTTSLRKNNEKRTVVILVATSGDTGKAALEGFCDVDGTKIMVFYPNNGVSKIQQKQMTTQSGNNVNVCAIEGNFDDAQSGVKAIFGNAQVAKELDAKGYFLSSANSINWGRLVPQIVYYVHAYCEMVNAGNISLGEKINIVVPTGNFGNILAAYYAYRMGLPVNKFICASNANKVLTDFINTGVYDKRREFYTTASPSMDILISSNLERMLYYITDGSERVAELMAKLSKEGMYALSGEETAKLQELFACGCCDDEKTAKEIGALKKEYGYTVDTHTAVAMSVYREYLEKTKDETPCVIASTASPFKFAASVIEGLGESVEEDEFENLVSLAAYSGMECPEQLATLKNKEVRFSAVCQKEDMQAMLYRFLNM